jgi:hypothetical protein
MTLRMQTYDSGTSTWNDVDLEAQKISDFKLQIGYSHPSTLSFTIYQPQQSTPIPPYKLLRFWDEGANDADGTAFSASNPTFIGYAEVVNPGDDSNKIEYQCYDPTARAANQVQIMSTAWTDATTEGLGAVPRLVYNSNIDNDDDYAFCRDFGLTVGQIIANLLDDALPRLRELAAAPVGDIAYVAADLTNMNYEPQEKIVFMSEGIRSGIMRIMNDWEPQYRMLFSPKTVQWRFGDITASTTTTRTLNDFTAAHPILQFQLNRNLEGRYTAVKFYGPEALENRTVTLSGGGLIDVDGNAGPTLETYGAGLTVNGKSNWRIADSTRRRIGRILPQEILVNTPEFRWAPNAWTFYTTPSRAPTFEARWNNTSAGHDIWSTIAGWYYDRTTGTITFGSSYVYRYNNNPAPGDPHYENPVDVRFIYPSFIDPLSVRVPSTGYEGTAYTDYGLGNELRIYDEMLAVGFEYGTAVTSATRLAKFQVLAQKILNTKKDVLHTGGMTLEGMDYEFHGLGRRVNVDGVDGDGVSMTTGWESINAIVTDVEYDYEQQVTTIQFSTDQTELTGFDPERIKTALKIGAASLVRWLTFSIDTRKREAFTDFGTPVIGADISITGEQHEVVVDPYFGTIDKPLYNVGD